MQEPAVDFIIFIIVLGIVISISFNLTIPQVKQAKEVYYEEMYDKTVSKLEGDRVGTSYDGCMTSSEVLLTAMGQTYFIAEPGKLDVCGTKIDISNNVAFSPNSLGLGTQVNSIIKTWFNQFSTSALVYSFQNPPTTINNARFKITFSMNNADDKNDDTYSVFILLKKNGKKEPELFKCESGGRLRDKDGVLM